MRFLLLLVAAATLSLVLALPVSADPEPATVQLNCTQPGATIPPGPPEREGQIVVTPSPNSGQGPTVTTFVPGPCGAPGFNR
jgi:hypothetical protein